MSHVWDHSKQNGAALLLLLAIADFADDKGMAWPAVETLATKIRMSERYVHRLIKDMEKAGEIRIDYKAGKNGTNRYWIILDPEPQFSEPEVTVNPSAADPEPQFAETLNHRPPEPSVNHQEPSVGLTPSAAFYFETFKRKRWSNSAQAELFSKLEAEVGPDILTAAIRWAAEKNIPDLHAIRTAAKLMQAGPKPPPATFQPPKPAGGGPWGNRPSNAK